MLALETAKKFEKDLNRLHKRGKNVGKLEAIVEKLRTGETLEHRHRPHVLSGDWDGYWELHVEGDWLLIYKITETMLSLVRTGTHSDLF